LQRSNAADLEEGSMQRAKPVLFPFGATTGGGRWPACGVAGLAALAAGGSAAAEPIDCAAISKGALNSVLAATAKADREVKLRSGERLAFRSSGSGPGSVTLVSERDTPRMLLAGSAGASGSYSAPRDGTYLLRFTGTAAGVAAISVTCTPASGSRTVATQKHPAAITPERWEGLLSEVETASAEPNLEAPVTIPGSTVPLPASVPAGSGTANGSARPTSGLDARLKWEGKAGEANAPQDPPRADTTDAGTTLGVKYKLQPQIMIGVLAQLDQPADTTPGAPRGISQQPWLAGPVATVQLAPGLALDARAAWGSGEASLADRLAGISATERRLIDAKLASTQSFGPWRFSPSVTLNYAEEKAAGSAVATTHDVLAGRTTGAGRVDVTPEVAYRIEMPQAMYIEPKAAVGSFWDIEGLSRLAPRGTTHDDMRLKAEAGVTIGNTTAGTKLEVGGGVEGGGAAAPDVWSGRLQLSVPLK
jgi:hypothetical protein